MPTELSDVTSLFNQALALHQGGRLIEAEPLYRKVLLIQPRHFNSLNLLGVLLYQCGRYQHALEQIDAALTANPLAAEAHNNRGAVLNELQRFDEAVASYCKAIELKPDYADAFYNRGNVLRQLEHYREAVADYDRATVLKPNHADAFNNRGNALKGLKKFEEAVASYDRALALKPSNADAWHNRAGALNELKRFDEALASAERAIALQPMLAEAFNNRGNALKDLKRFEEALASYEQAIALKPDYPDAMSNRGITLTELKRFDEALASYEHAIAANPDHREAHFNRGATLFEMERLDEALASYDRAIAIDPSRAEALYSRGMTLLFLKRLDEAVASYERAIELDPDLRYLKGIRLHAKMHLCDWTHFREDCAGLHDAIGRGIAACFPFQLLACPSSAQVQLECAKIYVAKRLSSIPRPLWSGERYAHQRIRVAYISSDFRNHPVAHLTVGLFEQHDRMRFETVGVSLSVARPSPIRERVKGSFDRFIDAQAMSDEDVAKLLRSLEVDIMVDLNGITDGARPYVFSQRPAPVQISYLGYAATSGPSHCDYVIADRFIIPEDARCEFAEQVVYLPDTFMVTDRTRKISTRAPSRQEAGLPDGGFVFCCFNSSFKITPDLFEVWMRLLRAIESSVLWLPAPGGSTMSNLRREAEQRGVSADRLVFAPKTRMNEDHLARLRLADLFVDTLYYTAHATACDALWAGLPVLTCAGSTYASRVAGSLLSAVGLPELITHSLAEYESLALRLARHPNELATLRTKLARQGETYPLFDTARFTRHLEAAYTTMWNRCERGEPPQSFAVEAIDRGAERQ